MFWKKNKSYKNPTPNANPEQTKKGAAFLEAAYNQLHILALENRQMLTLCWCRVLILPHAACKIVDCRPVWSLGGHAVLHKTWNLCLGPTLNLEGFLRKPKWPNIVHFHPYWCKTWLGPETLLRSHSWFISSDLY